MAAQRIEIQFEIQNVGDAIILLFQARSETNTDAQLINNKQTNKQTNNNGANATTKCCSMFRFSVTARETETQTTN